MTTPQDLLTRELRRDGARPLITWYGAAAERVELSVATTANWVAKTAGYLEDEIGIAPGDRVSIDPVLHWLTAVALLATWAVGAEPSPSAEPLKIPLDPMGATFSRLVAAYPDSYGAASPSGEAAVAAAPDLPAGSRLLTMQPLDREGAALGLLAPLAAGGSVVYAAPGSDVERIAGTERATHTAGTEIGGLPRLG